jgi:hypothetical protein
MHSGVEEIEQIDGTNRLHQESFFVLLEVVHFHDRKPQEPVRSTGPMGALGVLMRAPIGSLVQGSRTSSVLHSPGPVTTPLGCVGRGSASCRLLDHLVEEGGQKVSSIGVLGDPRSVAARTCARAGLEGGPHRGDDGVAVAAEAGRRVRGQPGVEVVAGAGHDEVHGKVDTSLSHTVCHLLRIEGQQVVG